MNALVIRAASREEFSVAADWAAGEGWNPGLDDLEAFFAADPGGFLMGFEGGEPVTSISVVRYGEDYGFLGFYIARPDRRGTGAGIATWRAGMARLAGRVVGLDGVVAQQANYRRSGFELAGRNVRYSGEPVARGGGRDEARRAGPAEASRVIAYDRAFFPGPREDFVERWLSPGPSRSRWGRMVIRDGAVAGYGVARACREGSKIGPLFAQDRWAAETLFSALCLDAPSGPVSLDVPEGNAAAAALAEDAGLSPVFETARMYRGKAPELPLARTFGITTFELG